MAPADLVAQDIASEAQALHVFLQQCGVENASVEDKKPFLDHYFAQKSADRVHTRDLEKDTHLHGLGIKKADHDADLVDKKDAKQADRDFRNNMLAVGSAAVTSSVGITTAALAYKERSDQSKLTDERHQASMKDRDLVNNFALRVTYIDHRIVAMQKDPDNYNLDEMQKIKETLETLSTQIQGYTGACQIDIPNLHKRLQDADTFIRVLMRAKNAPAPTPKMS